MRDGKLGIGIVGLHEGRTLLAALSQPEPPTVGDIRNAEPRTKHAYAAAACDLDPQKITHARLLCPDIFYSTRYEDILARDDIDIIAIYTPDPYHGAHIVQAFEAGKHVICTKPLVNSMGDARQVWDVAQRTGCKLLVGQSTRFFESFQRQRSAYEQGDIGEIELLDAHYVHRMDWFYDKSQWALDATDWVYLGLSHPLDLLRWYLGSIAEVQAYGSRSALARHYGVESFDVYNVNARSVDGRLGRVMGHYGLHELPSARNAIELVLYGTRGTSMAQYHDMRYFYTRPDGTEVKEDILYSKRAYYFNNEVHGMHYGEFANYADYFASALLTDSPYSPDLREGLETVCLMAAVRQSALSGKPVQVGDLLKLVWYKVILRFAQ
jgi:predicted dehydrogenase